VRQFLVYRDSGSGQTEFWPPPLLPILKGLAARRIPSFFAAYPNPCGAQLADGTAAVKILTMKINALLLTLVALLAAGCQSSVTQRTYNYQIANNLSEPITIFLTKTGPPNENGWLAPEQLAAAPISEDNSHEGKVVPPNTQLTATATGKFIRGSDAVLRIYRVRGSVEDYAAIDPGNPKRADITLHDGNNNIIVSSDDSEMTVRRIEP
jgi:hypothetical protein